MLICIYFNILGGHKVLTMKVALIYNSIALSWNTVFWSLQIREPSHKLSKARIWPTICKALEHSYFPNKSQNDIFILFLCAAYSCDCWSISPRRTIRQFKDFVLLDLLFYKLIKKSLALINNNKHLLSCSSVSGTLLVTLLKEESHSKANVPS